MTKKEISKLKEDNFNNKRTIEKFQRDFQEFDSKIKILEEENEKLKESLEEAQYNNFELPSDPIRVAEMLIDADYPYKNIFTGTQHRGRLYSKSDLRQIAEHLMVYCNNSEDE